MNKIIADKGNIFINNKNVDLNIKTRKINIDTKGHVVINDISNNDDLDLNLNVGEDAYVIYNKMNVLDSNNFNIKIVCKNNSKISFNFSNLILGKTKGIIDTIFDGNNIVAAINYKAVTQEKGNINLVSNLEVKNNKIDNEFLESLHVLMLNDEENTLIPNLNVESDKIIANHEVTMSGIDSNYLHYLQSKGIGKEKANLLIKEGFLVSNLKIDSKKREKIKKYLKVWR